MIIRDDTGKGYGAKVGADNRLNTRSVNTPRFTENAESNNDGYLFSTAGFLNITTINTEYGLFYLQNTSETKHLHINRIRTCGTGVSLWKIYFNPTGGTLISGALAGTSVNTILSSAATASANSYYGGQGITLTGGDLSGQLINNTGHSTDPFDGAVILGTNDSIALTVEVPVTNTRVCSFIMGWYETNEHDF